jgi:flagellar M-ring protein FliF
MGERLAGIIAPLRQFWSGLSVRVKRLSIAALALIIVAAAVGSFLLNSEEYVAIYTALPEYEQTEIVAQLNDMGVSVRFDDAGRIMVPASQQANVRMQLAIAGYPKNGLSYYYFEENNSVLTTDYSRKQIQYMGYQERIGATIKTLDGVRDAIVNIPMPSESVFYLQEQNPPTASVTIHMLQGYSLTRNQISGIRNLVATAVTGLTLENITITDGSGNSLLDENMTGASGGAEYRREYENDIRRKVLGMLTGPYLYEDLRVEVTASVNTSPSFSDRQTYYPEGDGNTGVINREAESSETYSSTEGVANVPGTDENSQVPIYPTNVGTGETSSSASGREVDYSVTNERVQTVNNGDTIESVSVAVAVNKASFVPGEAASIAELAAAAANVPIENVTVRNFSFSVAETPDEPETEAEGFNRYLLLGIIAGGVLLIALLILLLLMRRRKKAAEAAAAAEAEAAAAAEAAMIEYDEEGRPILPSDVEIGPITPMKDKRREEIQEFARQNPEITAQMIKTLLKTEEGN